MTTALAEAYSNALRAMEGKAPKGLLRRAVVEAEDLEPVPDVSETELRNHLDDSDPNDELRLNLHLNLAKWDSLPASVGLWTDGTAPNTDLRRSVIIASLALESDTEKLLGEMFPVATPDDTAVIAGPWDPWYTAEVQQRRDFYWRHYIDYLHARRGWKPEAIAKLDVATTHVVERLVDPAREAPRQTKGLVVGYVQSGKTANFTGVIAKAIDAGYRLVIVMTGTTNLLREQTQRRLDMELIGRENVLRGIDENDLESAQHIDYRTDEDWINDRFVRHGVRPSEVGRPEIHRMTTRNFDYRRLQQGLPALEFERRDRTKPLWHPDNLFTSDARLIIVKKNSSVLNNLVKDLKNNADKLGNIPTLIIDDESDQASVNTTDPRKWEEEKKNRTAINKHISNLLSMLPRAQYVGYTATPFANVFVDPSDSEDIFPGDYLISLERPAGYMGAEDFHDLDQVIPEHERTFANSKEKAHLRLLGTTTEAEELQTALDSFVLAGAIKLYRESFGQDPFKHHTMLVHETMRTAIQKSRAELIRELWDSSGYLSGSAISRLQKLFETDFSAVSAALNLNYPIPLSFAELTQFLGAVVRRIAPNGNPVLVVNSDKDIEQEDLDFDKRSVWRILVGGNKLARGFTVEGLTITYYSRNVGHAEALMQMGRWFGFRPGYRDLVRLFITSRVRDEFEAACRDEEHFRGELRQYAVMVDGRPKITPYDIQPLVIRHRLRPTAANKMYNAKLVERRTKAKEPSSGYPRITQQSVLDQNIDTCLPLLKAVGQEVVKVGVESPFSALVGSVTHAEMVEVLGNLVWATSDTFAPDFAWIAGLPDTVVDRWTVIMPQLTTRQPTDIRGVGKFTVHGRKVESGDKIRGNSESRHRDAWNLAPGHTETSGTLILYPVASTTADPPTQTDGRPQGVVMAIWLRLPDRAVPIDGRPLVYKVAARNKPLYALIED